MIERTAAALLFALAALPASTALAQTEETTPDTVRVCSAFVENNWRMAMPVNSHWLPEDCRQYALSVGATSFQLGCIFDSYRGGRNVGADRPQKFSWGRAIPVTRAAFAGDTPLPTCGWTAPRPAR